MKPRKTVATLLMVFVAAGQIIYAQIDSRSGDRQSVLSISPVFHSWSLGDDISMSQFTAIIALTQPIGNSTSLTLRASPSSTAGDPARLSGVTDMQVRATHALEEARLVLSLGVNIPTGKTELTGEEFASSMILSSPALTWSVPGFGQGLNLQPAVVWAIPFGEKFVGGLGFAYQYKGAFKAIKGYDEFDPGDEIAITGGVDVQLAEATNLSADVLFTMYGADKLGSDEVFKAGGKIVATAQFSKGIGQDELAMLARYRTRGKGEVGFAGSLVSAEQEMEPNQLDLHVQYGLFMSDRLRIRVAVGARLQSETPAELSGASLFGARVSPDFTLSRSFSVAPWVRYQAGTAKNDRSIRGIEAGLGMRIGF